MTLRKGRTGLLEALRKPLTPVHGYTPMCDICRRPVDSEEVVERAGPTAVRVLVKHHGAEELQTFELGTESWDHDDLNRAMRSHRWFAPVLDTAQ